LKSFLEDFQGNARVENIVLKREKDVRLPLLRFSMSTRKRDKTFDKKLSFEDTKREEREEFMNNIDKYNRNN